MTYGETETERNARKLWGSRQVHSEAIILEEYCAAMSHMDPTWIRDKLPNQAFPDFWPQSLEKSQMAVL